MPDNSAPFEIIAAPFTLHVAPVGTPFPDVDAEPAVTWVKVGTSGDRNYTEDGVTVQHSRSIEKWRAVGSPGPRKAWPTEEDLIIGLTLADLSLEQYQLALNHQTVATVAAGVGTAGYKSLGLSRGLSLPQRALLIRGASPYGDGFTMQYEVPVAYQSGSPEVVFRKNEPAALALEWTALEDPDAATENERFGRILAQTADAET